LKNAEFLPDSVQESLIEACGSVADTRFWEQPPDRQDGDAPKSQCPVRLMSSSSAGLRAAVDEDRLSEEIYHLLTTQEIHVPPLRDRQDDFPLLGLHFLETLNRDEEEQVTDFAEDVWLAFRKYS